MKIQSLFLVGILSLVAGPLFAQDAATISNPAISPDQLANEIAHLEASELEPQVKGWIALLKAKVQEIGAANNKNEPVDALVAQRDEIAQRLEVVLKAYGNRGGDRTAYDKYVGDVTGGALLTTVLNWVKSPDKGLQLAKNIAIFLILLFIFRIVAKIAAGLVGKAVTVAKVKVSDILKDFFVGTVRKVVFLVGLVIALPFIGIDVGPFLAAIGVAGFVIGFALQDTLGNFAAGLMILLYRPYDLGHVISAAGVTGKVHAMSLVSTTLRTPDNQDVVVPNGSIWGGVITNVTGNDTRRVDMVFGIGYEDDIAKAQSVLEDILKSHELTLDDPAPVVQLHELADSSVNFIARPWAKTSDYWAVYWDVTRTVKERFDKEGLSIPYPQQDVHMHQVNS